MNIVYVVVVQHDDIDAPSFAWVTTTQREAANTLRNYAGNFLGGYVCDANDMPADDELVRVLRENGEQVRVLECVLDGFSGDEIDPFSEPSRVGTHGHPTAVDG
jgi:hypothetical protein